MDLTRRRRSAQTEVDRDGDVIMDDYRMTEPRPSSMMSISSLKAFGEGNVPDRGILFTPFLGHGQLPRPRLLLPALGTHPHIGDIHNRPPVHKQHNTSPVLISSSLHNQYGNDMIQPDPTEQRSSPQRRPPFPRQSLPPIVLQPRGDHSSSPSIGIHTVADRHLPPIASIIPAQYITNRTESSPTNQLDRPHVSLLPNLHATLGGVRSPTKETSITDESWSAIQSSILLTPSQNQEQKDLDDPSQYRTLTINPTPELDLKYQIDPETQKWNQDPSSGMIHEQQAAVEAQVLARMMEVSRQEAERIQARRLAIPVSRKKKISVVKKLACTACMEDFINDEIITAPCGCKYCRACLNQAIRSGCTSAADFPPKCHGKAIRINIFGPVLDTEVVKRYKEVEAEFSSKRPFYCASQVCSAFIVEKDIVQMGGYGICGECNQCTCTSCKMLLSLHDFGSKNRVCPPEPKELLALRNLCEDEEWKQCPSCQIMVEKVDGCDHIECQCGVEFCYRCGSYYTEHDECNCSGDDLSDDEGRDEDDEDELEAWPQHRRMLDAMGRPVCAHPDTDLLFGEICHGCLRPPQLSGQIHSCVGCGIELCKECLDKIRGIDGADVLTEQ